MLGGGADMGNAIEDVANRVLSDGHSEFTQGLANELVKKYPHKNGKYRSTCQESEPLMA